MAALLYKSPVGPLTIYAHDEKIVAVEFGQGMDATLNPASPVLQDCKAQLEAYFQGQRTSFELPFELHGTVFQQKVWAIMAKIPPGQVRTYGDVAKQLNSSPRAVGGACGANPLPVLIPCHRIVGADGKLTGYSGGEGLETKRALLRLEGYTP